MEDRVQWDKLTLQERFAAMRFPDFDPWTAVFCLVGLAVSWWFLRRIERRFAEGRAQHPLGDDPQDPRLEAQRIIAWLAIIYFGFTSSFLAIAVVGSIVQVLPWWIWLPLLPYGAWHWWRARQPAEAEPEDEDAPPR